MKPLESRDVHLPSGKDQPLLRWGDTRLLLNLLLDSRDLYQISRREVTQYQLRIDGAAFG